MCAEALTSLHGAPTGQPPGEPQRTFRSGVDLVTLEVSVADRDGDPVLELVPADFAVTVDGRTRRVASATFVGSGGAAESAALPAPAHYSTNAGAASGRLLALIVDQGNLAPEGARPVLAAARRFLERLPAADRVGVHAVPGPGPDIPFSGNRALVAAQLSKVAGSLPSSAFDRVGVAEAVRITRGDRGTLARVAARECGVADAQACAQEIEDESRALVDDARARARASITALRALVERLAASRTPKTAVLLSEALVVEDGQAELGWLAPLAAKGQITLHVVRVPGGDASAGARRAAAGEDAAALEEGLTMLAGLTGGSFFRASGSAEGIFDRIARTMSGYYVLGIEPEEADRDGRTRRIRVEVRKARGGSVRARQDFSAPVPIRRTDEEVVAETLQSLAPATEIALSTTAYTFPEADRGAVRVVMAAEIDGKRGGNRVELALGYALLAEDGRVVASGFEPRLTEAGASGTGTQVFVTSARATPGVYSLKLAAVDAAGRRGSVQHTFRAQVAALGRLRVGDLLIGVADGTRGTAPAVSGEFSDPESLNGYVELSADTRDALDGVSVVLEVAANENGPPLAAVGAVLVDPDRSVARRRAEAVLPIPGLPPGDYLARAIVTVDGRTAGRVARPFRVRRSSGAATLAPSSPSARGRAAAPLAIRIGPFAPAQVLTPEVVGFALSRAAAPGAPLARDVAAHARAGRIAEALEAARTAGHGLAAAFLQGLMRFAGGDLEGAAVAFREALRLDSEFFPATFYLGSCYAAGGREREAAAAWQTSLVGEDSAPFVYALLGDSLLRQREMDRALEILNEGMARWPADPGLRLRLGQALAMSGRPADALRILDGPPPGSAHELERLLLAMRLIYDAAVRGERLVSRDEDLARFDRDAAAYAASRGPQQPMIQQWRRFLAGHAR